MERHWRPRDRRDGLTMERIVIKRRRRNLEPEPEPEPPEPQPCDATEVDTDEEVEKTPTTLGWQMEAPHRLIASSEMSDPRRVHRDPRRGQLRGKPTRPRD